MYIAEIESRVAGIPCLIGVLDWEAYVPAKVSGPPEYCYPSEGGCGSWEVLDRRGRKAPWLERKMTAADERRIEQDVFEAMESKADDWY
jgi:hypothetical protein